MMGTVRDGDLLEFVHIERIEHSEQLDLGPLHLGKMIEGIDNKVSHR